MCIDKQEAKTEKPTQGTHPQTKNSYTHKAKRFKNNNKWY